MGVTLVDYLFQILLGMAITGGFAILFNVPRHTLFTAAAVGAIGHTFRFALRQYGVSNELATFFGALTVGLVGYSQSVRFKMPRLVFTVTGIISMIPGIPAYEVLVYFAEGDILGGLTSAIRAMLLTGAIAIGLSTARLLTESEWARKKPTKRP